MSWEPIVFWIWAIGAAVVLASVPSALVSIAVSLTKIAECLQDLREFTLFLKYNTLSEFNEDEDEDD